MISKIFFDFIEYPLCEGAFEIDKMCISLNIKIKCLSNILKRQSLNRSQKIIRVRNWINLNK